MDSPLPTRRWKYLRPIGLAVLVLSCLGLLLWYWLPNGLMVRAADLRIASVQVGVFHDIAIVRASAEPLHSVVLDALESGRVEEIVVRDGELVKRGQLLFRLSNPQRILEKLARQAELAQQISNLSNLRLAQESNQADYQRRYDDLEFTLQQQEKLQLRQQRLGEQGFVSSAAVEESSDRLIQQRRLVQAEQRRAQSDAVVRQAALQQMESVIGGLQQGLSLVNAALDALSVRAPTAGRLTGFRLQVGEAMRPDQHLGRIDDPEHFKLTAQADEFYLPRMSAGWRGVARLHDRDYAVEVKVIYPQIKEGRFSFELEFVDTAPAAISPGQSLDVQITLGAETQAMVLEKGAFLNDSGGAWVFVVSVGGHHAQRRNVVLGRRSAGQVEVLSGLAPGDSVIVSSYAGFGQATALQFTQ